MSVVANVAINVDASRALSQLGAVDRAVDGVARSFNSLPSKISGAFQAVGTSVQGLGTKISNLGNSFTGLGSAVAGIGVGALITGFGQAGIAADRSGKTIQALAGPYNEVDRLQTFAAKSATAFGLGQTTAAQSVSDLYGRLRPMGVSLADIEKTYTGVNKAAMMMNLSGPETEAVLLQLSQAMGSGALQGDELRSIMERLPAVGQAIARTMGVTVGEIKQLGADGRITTDIIIQAMGQLNSLEPPPPDPYKRLSAAMEDLATAIGKMLLPLMGPLATKLTELAVKMEKVEAGAKLAQALTPLADLLGRLLDTFLGLDPKMQAMIIQFVAIAAAVSLVVVPIGLVIGAFGKIVAAFGGLFAFLSGPTIAGLISSIITGIGGIITWMSTVFIPGIISAFSGFLAWVGSTFIPAIVAFFSGPVGWTVLAVAAVVAMVVLFRKPIGKFLSWLGSEFTKAMQALGRMAYDWLLKPFVNLWNNQLRQPVGNFITWINASWNGMVRFFADYVIKPISKLWNDLMQLLPNAMKNLVASVKSVWDGIVNTIKNAIRGVMSFIVNNLNNIGGQINKLIGSFNRLPGPDIPFVPSLQVPAFAEGGYVGKGTLAMVGEAGPEYIVPEKKMAQASANFLSGARGGSVIPSGSSGAQSGSTPQINVTTGPVMEMNGERYITVADFEQGLRQVANNVYKNLRTPAGRYAVGVR